jgi:hypothetical protein
MKQITKNTILRQNNKTYQPVEVDGVIYWTDFELPKDRQICITFHKETKLAMVDKDGFYEEDLDRYAYSPLRIIAQSKIADGWKLAIFPIISLNEDIIAAKNAECLKGVFSEEENYQLRRSYFLKGFNSNPNQYTQKDIDKTIAMSKIAKTPDGLIDIDAWISSGYEGAEPAYTEEEILEQINQISVIEVDDQFNIVSYE